MKKIALTLCVVGSSLALAACGTMSGDDLNPSDYEAPYANERTAGGETEMAPVRARPAPVRAERTFSAAQTK